MKMGFINRRHDKIFIIFKKIKQTDCIVCGLPQVTIVTYKFCMCVILNLFSKFGQLWFPIGQEVQLAYTLLTWALDDGHSDCLFFQMYKHNLQVQEFIFIRTDQVLLNAVTQKIKIALWTKTSHKYY